METIPELLEHSVRMYGQMPAFHILGEAQDDTGAYTFRQVGCAAVRLSQKLREWGTFRGSRVAILSENRPQWGVAYFAIHLAEAVGIPVDARLKAGEIHNILVRSRTRIVLASSQMVETAQKAAEGLPHVQIEVLDDTIDEKTMADVPADFTVPRVPIKGSDLAVISFSSGTTGNPKGVMLTHKNLVSNVISASKSFRCGPGDRFLSLLPLSHIFEKTAGMLYPFYNGAAVTYLRSLNPRIIADAMRRNQTTVCLIVPAVAKLFQKRILQAVQDSSPIKRSLFWSLYGLSKIAKHCGWYIGPKLFGKVRAQFGSKIRFFMSGGAALDPEIAEFFECLGLYVHQGYGLSETAPVVCCNTEEHHRIGSVGKPLADVEVTLKPYEGCEPGTGEILVRGENVMIGYYEEPELSSEVLQGGYMHTGDIGRIDKDGFVYITGRAKNVIISDAGKNVYPEEVENEIAKSPLVKEVCVIGLTGKTRRAEEVAVLVVPHAEFAEGKHEREIAEAVRKELKKLCRNLADYKQPKHLAISIEELPKTTTLKHKKAEITKKFTDEMFQPL